MFSCRFLLLCCRHAFDAAIRHAATLLRAAFAAADSRRHDDYYAAAIPYDAISRHTRDSAADIFATPMLCHYFIAVADMLRQIAALFAFAMPLMPRYFRYMLSRVCRYDDTL